MNYHIAARMDRMAPSGIRKVNEKALAMERAGEKVLHFEIGRPDFDTPEYIKKAADQAIAEGKVHYTSNFGLMELRQAIADKLQRENHVDYKASEVLVTVGLSEAVFAVLAALLDEGDELLVPDPVWLNYINVPNLLGAKAVTYSLKEENGYQMDLDEVRAKITSKTRGIVIVTPNNPTGVVYSRQTLEGLAELLRRKSTQFGHPIYLIADEPYRELVYDGVEVPFLPTIYPNTLVCYSYSKSLSLPGERIGYVCVPSCVEGQADVLHAVAGAARSSGHVCPPTLVQLALQRCADARPDLAAYDANRRLLYRELTQMGYECIPPQGAFYLFVRVPDGDDVAFSQRAKLEHDLLVVPSTAFHCPGFLRLSYCVSHDMILRSLPAFRAIREKYQ